MSEITKKLTLTVCSDDIARVCIVVRFANGERDGEGALY